MKNHDIFIKNLIDLFDEAALFEKEHSFEDYGSFNVIRTDFMVDEETDNLCLVEINTMASGMAMFASDEKIGKFHRFTEDLIATRLGIDDGNRLLTHNYPDNQLMQNVTKTFLTAYSLYPSNTELGEPKPAVLFIVQSCEAAGLSLSDLKKAPR